MPRSRLVKYPLLFRNIQSRTPANHEDIGLLEEAIATIEEIIHDVDRKTGEAKCRFFVDRLEYLEEAQVSWAQTLVLFFGRKCLCCFYYHFAAVFKI